MRKPFLRIAARAAFGMACAALSCMAAAAELTLCAEAADVRPWRTRDHQGLNFTLLNRAAKLAGVSFKYETTTWPRCLAKLKAGEVDGAFAASFKPERTAIGVFPGGASPDPRKRLHVDRYVAVRKRGSGVDWDGRRFARLDGKVGTQLGYSINDSLQKLGVETDDGAQTADALVRKLAFGRVPVAGMLEGEVRAVLHANPQQAADIEILPVPLEEKPYYLMLSNALVRGRPQVAAKVWNAIESVRESAEYRKEEREALAAAYK